MQRTLAPANKKRVIALSFLSLGLLALFTGMWAGLVRLGWLLPVVSEALPILHGPLMVAGFLGTLIGLERALALQRRWPFGVPFLTGIGTLMLLLGGPLLPGKLLIMGGSLGLVAVFGWIYRRRPSLFTVIMALGAGSWWLGNTLWLVGWPVYRLVLWWAAFLILTIGGERLELSRLQRISTASWGIFLGGVALLLVGLFGITLPFQQVLLQDWTTPFNLGWRLTGSGMLILALWLYRNDIARHTVRQRGLMRFTAGSMLAGYFWLATAGLLGLAFGGLMTGPRYDAVLHALFLGFVMAMILAHAPIVFPAILGLPMPFSSTFYLPLALLHFSLLLRVGCDLAGWWAARQWGEALSGGWLQMQQWAGLLNVIAILLFLLNSGRVIRKGPVQPVS